MNYFFLVVLCFAQVILNAQDTIYKRSGDVIPAKVIEINTKEVSYKRESMPDGPLFILTKNEVKKIKYKTGAVDSFTVVKTEELKPTAIVYTYNEEIKKYKASLFDPYHNSKLGLYLYHGNKISDNKAMLLAAAKNAVWKNPQLESEIFKVKRNKTWQYATGFGGLGLGLLAAASAVVYSVNEPLDYTGAQIMLASGVGAVITTQVLSIHFKIQRTKHSDKAVAIYNQNL